MKRINSLKFSISLAGLLACNAMAATTTSWLTPPNGSSYAVGTIVNPTGVASGVGTSGGGQGLDLAFVLDASGSMGFNGGAGEAAQEAAAIALVASLPGATTSVAIIRFNSSATVALGLTGVSGNISTINNAITGTMSGGGTNIAAGIQTAAEVLTGAGHTAGRTQMMVVISDGASTSGGSPATAADNAVLAGVDNIHSVGVPGHNVGTMQSIVDGPDNNHTNAADNYGIYTSGSLESLVALFNGTGGNLVGLDYIDITLPDGTILADYATDGLGNFVLPNWAIQAGANTFHVAAYGTDNTSASASWTLYGTQPSSPPSGVPDGGSTLALLGVVLGSLAFLRKTKAC